MNYSAVVYLWIEQGGAVQVSESFLLQQSL